MTVIEIIPTSMISSTMLILILLFSGIGIGFLFFPSKNLIVKEILGKIGYMVFIFAFFMINIQTFFMWEFTKDETYSAVTMSLFIFMTIISMILVIFLLILIFQIIIKGVIGVVEDGFKDKNNADMGRQRIR